MSEKRRTVGGYQQRGGKEVLVGMLLTAVVVGVVPSPVLEAPFRGPARG